jgi:hypothetical protein
MVVTPNLDEYDNPLNPFKKYTDLTKKSNTYFSEK